MEMVTNISGLDVELTQTQKELYDEIQKKGFYDVGYTLTDDEQYLVTNMLVNYSITGKILSKI